MNGSGGSSRCCGSTTHGPTNSARPMGLVVQYEDLHARPDAELRRVLAFAGVDDVTPDVVADAVEFGSFDHMRQLEETGRSRRAAPGARGDHDTYKARRGTVGGHRDELTVEQIRVSARCSRRRVRAGSGTR